MREIRAREMGLRNEETKLKGLELKREKYEARERGFIVAYARKRIEFGAGAE